MQVAVVHDWLTGMRGGERVLEAVCELLPDADLFTLVHVPGATSPRIESRPIQASFLSRMPGIARHYRAWLPLFPAAIRSLDLAGYDLIVSCSHAVAKSVRVPEGARHLSYCFTPMRYVWDQRDAYLGSGLVRLASWPLAAALRHFDRRTSREEDVHRFVAISGAVRERIARSYGREATVVHPPVDTGRVVPAKEPERDFYLLVGGFVPYKRDAVAIEAFRALERRLVVVGDGPGRRMAERFAPANVEFRGRVTDDDLAGLYAHCRALVYPQEEDFGIAAVEAQSAGRPVIALGRGGARDTVRPLGQAEQPTGSWFHGLRPVDLADAVVRFEENEAAFDPAAIRRWAEGFGAERWRREFRAELDAVLA